MAYAADGILPVDALDVHERVLPTYVGRSGFDNYDDYLDLAGIAGHRAAAPHHCPSENRRLRLKGAVRRFRRAPEGPNNRFKGCEDQRMA